jgi:hypothetical protein
METILQEINFIISKYHWLDMEIISTKGGNLVIACSIDFTYGHSLEIIFEDYFYISINSQWQTNTLEKVLYLVTGEEADAINLKYRIEYGYSLFKIKPEYPVAPFYISAKKVVFNTDKVYYYLKDNLLEGERIADWVKR